MIRTIILYAFTLILYTLFYLNNGHRWFEMDEIIGIMHFVALGVMVATMVVALIFNRSRLFFVLLLFLGFSFLAELFDYLRRVYPDLYFRSQVGVLLDLFLLSFASIYITALAWMKERGVITPKGWMRLGVLLAIFALYVYVLLAQLPWVSWVASIDLFFIPNTAIPDLLLLLLVINLSLVVSRFIFYKAHEPIFVIAIIGISLASVLPRTLDQLTILSTFFSLLAVVFIISNSYYMAYIDELTQLRGRRAMNEMLLRLGGKYSIVMGDIDHFKKFNDTYGHDVGDEVLKLVATELDRVKGGGEVFRWGGEEFAIIFNGKEAEETLEYIEKVRIGIEKRPFFMRSPNRPEKKPEHPKKRVTSPKQLFVTMSFGVATKTKDDLSTTEVMKKADKKLYEAKEAGRNCVAF